MIRITVIQFNNQEFSDIYELSGLFGCTEHQFKEFAVYTYLTYIVTARLLDGLDQLFKEHKIASWSTEEGTNSANYNL